RVGLELTVTDDADAASVNAEHDVEAEAFDHDPQRRAVKLRGELHRGRGLTHTALEQPLEPLDEPRAHGRRALQAETDMERDDAGRQVVIAAPLESAALHHPLQRALVGMAAYRLGEVPVARRVLREQTPEPRQHLERIRVVERLERP